MTSQNNSSLSFLSRFDPNEFFEIAKDLPNTIELDSQHVASHNQQQINVEENSNTNNVEIVGTHILVPEDSLNQMIGLHFNSNKLDENILIDFDTLSNIPASTSDMPCQKFPGPYDFHLFISSPHNQKATKKAISYTYSQKLNKLYCLPGIPCPIGINVSTMPPLGSIIRAQAFYTKYEHVHEKITRCENHKKNKEFENESADNFNEQIVSHFIRAHHPRAYYEINNLTLRESVVIPFERPRTGSNLITNLYKFMCYSSCIGGIQKPAKIVITLELNNEVLGCDTFEIKICACPGRDLNSEEKKLLPEENLMPNIKKEMKETAKPIAKPVEFKNVITKSKIEQSSTKKPQMSQIKIKSLNRIDESENDDNQIFTLQVKGRKNYEILKYLKEALEVKALMPNLKRIDSNHLNGCVLDKSNKEINNKPIIINKQSSLKDTPKKIKTLEQFLEYYEMSAYYNLFISKGIKSLEDLLNSNKKRINSLRISQSDTTKLLNCIENLKTIMQNSNKSVSFLLDDMINESIDSNNPGPSSKRQKLDDTHPAIDLSDLRGLSSANFSFSNKPMYSFSSYTIKGSFNVSV